LSDLCLALSAQIAEARTARVTEQRQAGTSRHRGGSPAVRVGAHPCAVSSAPRAVGGQPHDRPSPSAVGAPTLATGGPSLKPGTGGIEAEPEWLQVHTARGGKSWSAPSIGFGSPACLGDAAHRSNRILLPSRATSGPCEPGEDETRPRRTAGRRRAGRTARCTSAGGTGGRQHARSRRRRCRQRSSASSFCAILPNDRSPLLTLPDWLA